MFPAEMLDRLVADELQAHFPCATIGRQIIVLEQTGSTVTGRMEQAGTFAGPLRGSIVGNRLRYQAVDGPWGAEFTVAGDVMSGYGSLTRWRGTFRRDAPER